MAEDRDTLPLPEPRTLSRGDEDGPIQLGYTADQLRTYAEQVAAARVAQAVAQERERYVELKREFEALCKDHTAMMEAADELANSAQPAPAGFPVSAGERALRRLLAVRVAMACTYGDDGEMHGSEHGIFIDFMREPVAHIDAKLRALNVARAICAAAPQPPSAWRPIEEAESRSLTHIANLAHLGGTVGVDAYDCLSAIRSLTVNYWGKNGPTASYQSLVLAAMKAAAEAPLPPPPSAGEETPT